MDPRPVMQHFTDYLLPPPAAENVPAFHNVLAILHQPIPSSTPTIWPHAQMKVCLDEGANRLYDGMPLLFPGQDALHVHQMFIPDVLIRTHLNVIRPEVLEFYVGQGCEVHDILGDEDNTGVFNCVSYIQGRVGPNLDILRILATGAFGGRYDKHVSNLHVFYQFSALRIILLSDDSLVQLLPVTHRHDIHIDHRIVGPKCGLIPLGQPSYSSTTTGLHWNLNNTPMEFGSLISTSNLVDEGVHNVTVQSATNLVWTISIKKP